LRREDRPAQERAEDALAVCSEHGLLMYQAMATVTRGWALIDQGRQGDAIKQMRQGLAAHQATGTELMRPHFMALLAEGLGKASRPEQGLRALDEALVGADRTGDASYLAELYRIKGELLLMQPSGRNAQRAPQVGKEGEPP